jgi:hypothetical protein
VIDLVQAAEDDGFEAYVRGMRTWDNPLPLTQSGQRDAWSKGFFEARLYIDGWKAMRT